MTVDAPPSFFQSLSSDDIEQVLGSLARRRFAAGAEGQMMTAPAFRA